MSRMCWNGDSLPVSSSSGHDRSSCLKYALDESSDLVRVHTTEDEHLLDLGVAEALERPHEQRHAAEGQQDSGLVKTQDLEAAVERVGQDDGLQRRLVDIVAALGSAILDELESWESKG